MISKSYTKGYYAYRKIIIYEQNSPWEQHRTVVKYASCLFSSLLRQKPLIYDFIWCSLNWSFFSIYLKKFLLEYSCFIMLLVSGVQQSEPVIYIYICLLFFLKILFPYRPLQNIEQSSPCCTVDSYQLSILLYVSIPTSHFIPPDSPYPLVLVLDIASGPRLSSD